MSATILPAVYSKLPFNPQKQLTPVAVLATVPALLVVNPKVPARNLKELIAYDKANPGKLNYGSAVLHGQLFGEALKLATGLQYTYVPYKGSAEAVQALARDWVPQGASGQGERVGARFALVGVAGELATEAGLTGWPAGESERGARACFDAWMAARGGAGNGEVVAMLRAVRRFFESHGEGRFTWWHRASDDHNAKTLQRAGYRRLVDQEGNPIKMTKKVYTSGLSKDDQDVYDAVTGIDVEGASVEYFVLPEVFRAEVCNGFDYQAVARVLLGHGALMPGAGRSFDCKQRLPGLGVSNCYRIPPALFALDV
jgi:putative DNA primase/helicase